MRTGLVLPLAEAFTIRPETVPGLPAQLVPGAVIVLANGPAGEKQQPAVGPGSCGKTQLAAYLAESLWWARNLDLLAWVDASSRASVLAGYLQPAQAVGVDLAGPAEQAAAGFTGWLSETTRPWLVVLDDLRDPADLAALWPRGPAGTVLITTRDQGTVPSGSRVQVVPVGAFSTREALTYLMGRLTSDPDQRRGAIDLATELGGDPLALAQASAVIATTRLTCTDYRDHYTSRRDKHAQQTGGQPPAPAAVTTVVAAQHAIRLAPSGATQPVLALAALFGSCPVPGTVFTRPAVVTYLADAGAQAADPDQAWEAVLTLARTGLLTIDPTTTPPIVRISAPAAAQIRAATPEQAMDQAAHAAAEALAEAWPEHEPRPWLATGLRSCAANLIDTTGDRLWAAGDCHPVLLRAGHSLGTADLSGPAASYWAQLAATSDRLAGPDHPTTLTIGGHLARALLVTGHADSALAWAHWVLDGHTRRCGPSHPDTLAAQITLGQALTAAGKPGHAITVLDRAVAGHEHAHGTDAPATLTARDEFAAAYRAAGMPAEAAEVHRGTVAGRERAQGPDHRDTMAARDKLAAACLAAGQYDDAVGCYRRALADRQAVLGPDHLDTIASLASLAQALHAEGDMTAALPLHEQASRDTERVLGADHPQALTRQADLARAYQTAGRLADAAVLARGTLTRCEQALPPEHPLTQALRDDFSATAGDEPAPHRTSASITRRQPSRLRAP